MPTIEFRMIAPRAPRTVVYVLGCRVADEAPALQYSTYSEDDGMPVAAQPLVAEKMERDGISVRVMPEAEKDGRTTMVAVAPTQGVNLRTSATILSIVQQAESVDGAATIVAVQIPGESVDADVRVLAGVEQGESPATPTFVSREWSAGDRAPAGATLLTWTERAEGIAPEVVSLGPGLQAAGIQRIASVDQQKGQGEAYPHEAHTVVAASLAGRDGSEAGSHETFVGAAPEPGNGLSNAGVLAARGDREGWVDPEQSSLVDRRSEAVGQTHAQVAGSVVERLAAIERILAAEVAPVHAVVAQVERLGERFTDAHLEPPMVIEGQSDHDAPDIPDMDGIDRLNPPERDYRYKPEDLFDPETGEVFCAVSDDDADDVVVSMPHHHPLDPYDEGKQAMDVPLHLYQAMLEEIVHFWRDNFPRLLGEGADRALKLALDHLRAECLQPGEYLAERKRLFRFVRWYAEDALLRHTRYVLHRTFEDRPDLATAGAWQEVLPGDSLVIETDAARWTSVEASVLAAEGDRVSAYLESTGMRLVTRETEDPDRMAWAVPPGKHRVLVRPAMERALVRDAVQKGAIFAGASLKANYPPDTGPQSVQYLIKRLVEYWRLHHEGKAKGTRERWNLD